MTKIKQIICLIMIIAIVACSYTTVDADEVAEMKVGNDIYSLATPTYSTALLNDLIFAWEHYLTELDITSYKLKADKALEIFSYIINMYPEYFYLDESECSISYNVQTDYVYSFYFEYIDTTAQIKRMRSEFEEKSQKILDKMGSGMLAEDRIVFLHDYISTHNSYDPDGLTGDVDEVDYQSFTAYGCIVNHLSVCQGMSDAFLYLARKSGLDARMSVSDPMCHAWNIVKVGSNYYHLDITWDDNAEDAGLDFLNVNGFSKHTYFMKSDTQMISLRHNGWETDFSANDSVTFNNYYWNGVYSPIYLIKGSRYYVKNGTLYKNVLRTGATKAIYTFGNGTYTATNGKTYTFSSRYTTIAFDYNSNFLLFNSGDGVFAYNLYNNTVTKTLDAPEKGYIAGIAFFDDTLYYDIADYTTSSKPVQTADKTANVSYPTYNITLGDADLKDGINAGDALALSRYLTLIENENISEFTADVNGDNFINTKDLLLLKKYLAGLISAFGG